MLTPLKLFYSYAHDDEELRDELEKHLTMLKREGIISEWHDRAIVPGQEWDEEIQAQLNQADIILLLVSPDFLASDYIHRVELTRALERHDRGEAVVIPVILRQCQWTRTPLAKLQALPKNARPIKRWRDRDAAFDDVAEGIRRAADALPPTRQPPKPATSAVIPRPPAVGFVSRRDEHGRDILERLTEELAPGRGQLIALWGPGGSGKSTLAAEVARALRPAFDDRLAWVSALGRDNFSLPTLLDEIATQLGHPELRTLASAAKEEQVRALLSASPALVVLDNFETIKPEEQTACAAFLASCGECPALITTRKRVNHADILNVRLAAMEMNEAREFLRRLIEQADKTAFAGLNHDDLIRECEANPLIMQWVVGQIIEARRPQDVLNEIKGGEGDAAERVFGRSFDLPQLGDDGRDCLLAISLFAPDASREALAAAAGFGEDLRRLDKAVTNLSALWLVETTVGNERLLLRGLTRQLAKSRLAKDDRTDKFSERFAAYFLEYIATYKEAETETYNKLEREKDNLLGSLDIALTRQRYEDFMRVALILGSVEGILRLRGYWSEALQLCERGLRVATEKGNKWYIGAFADSLGSVVARQGDFTLARRYYEIAVSIAQEMDEEQGLAATLEKLGTLAQDQGDYDEARRLFGESLEIRKRLSNELEVAKTLHNLAVVAQNTGEVEEARRLYGESLEIKRRLSDQRGVANTLSELSRLAYSTGELDEAWRLSNESLEIRRRLGDQHGIAISLHALGMMAMSNGDKVTAERLLREALIIYERLAAPGAIHVRRMLDLI